MKSGIGPTTRRSRRGGIKGSLSEIKRARRAAKNERSRSAAKPARRPNVFRSKENQVVRSKPFWPSAGRVVKRFAESTAKLSRMKLSRMKLSRAKPLAEKLPRVKPPKEKLPRVRALKAKLGKSIFVSKPSRRMRPAIDRDPRTFGPRRIAIVSAVMLLGALAVLGRAAQLQLVDGDKYVNVAQRQATISSSINAKRGVIKDRHGAELAITVDVDSVFAEPKKIEDPSDAARQLAHTLEMPASTVARRLAKDKSFVYLKRRVTPEVAQKVRALQIRGVSTVTEPKRFYSNRELAAHVLGFASLDGNGRAGIERELDGDLRGKSYELPGLRDALGKTVFNEGFVPHSVLEGADVRLTIDRQIQYAAESALKEAVEASRGVAGVAVVLEPKSGDVLALASYPTFNPNNLKGTTSNNHLNRVVSAGYEPGSTMKMVTIAAGLEEKLIHPDDRIDCEGGRLRIGRRTINDSHHGYGELTIGEIMKVSSNVCSAKIGMQLGAERLHHWLYQFGFGEKTGVELPGELRGHIRPHASWREIGLANVAFGQGILVTPIQVAQAAATIANGGYLVRPRILKAITEKSGQRTPFTRPAKERVLSERTATEVRRMMEDVTKKGGTAEAAAIPGFAVAGKTGTAQKIDPVTKAYSHELYVASFVGFVPSERPEVVILVMVDQPRTSIFGGVVAAPAFRRIALASLSAREIFPEDRGAREAFLASYRAAPPAQASFGPAATAALPATEAGVESKNPAPAPIEATPEAALESALSSEAQALLGLADAAVSGTPKRDGAALKSGTPAAKAPPSGQVSPAEREARGGESAAHRMPNFAGLQLREVLNRSAEAHCDPVVTGTGRVVAQVPAAGVVMLPGARCELKLSPSG